MSAIAKGRAAERRRLANEAAYKRSSHGRRHQALIAAANGNMAPADAYRQEVERLARAAASERPVRTRVVKGKDKMSNAEIIDMLKGITARLERIESKLANATAVTDTGGEFAAVSLSATIDDGKCYWKVKGGPFMKHGIIIWPEVMEVTPFADADPMQVHDLTGWTAVYTENGDGHKKITALRPAGNAAPVARPAANGSGKPKIGKDAEAKAAEHWRKECETAANPFEFDTAMSKLGSVFPDANGAAWARKQIFGDDPFEAGRAAEYTAALLAYDEKRAALPKTLPKEDAHLLALNAALAACETAVDS